ncbi:MAG: ATP synthase F1 subunit gamma [Anaerolineales bacterium]|nr:ATP synthase F1 subunit gamma [Anaerolineales bacterium]
MRSVRNISQVTRALEAVSASKVRRAQQAVLATRAYAGKAFQVLQHLGLQPGSAGSLHPLLAQRAEIRAVTVVLVTSDRGLCGAYNTNMVRAAMDFVRASPVPVNFVAVGRKGRDLLLRRRQKLIAEFINLPGNPTFADVSAIGNLAVDEYLSGRADEVYLAYTDYINTLRQVPRVRHLLPLRPAPDEHADVTGLAYAGRPAGPSAAYIYEPSQEGLLDVIVPRFTALQVYQAILEAAASEHSARMVAMRNATDSAKELLGGLQLGYNKARQLAITSDLLDIVGGVEALGKAQAIHSSAELEEAAA